MAALVVGTTVSILKVGSAILKNQGLLFQSERRTPSQEEKPPRPPLEGEEGSHPVPICIFLVCQFLVFQKLSTLGTLRP